MFDVGCRVTRKSYNDDVIFCIVSITNNIAILKGIDVRLIADAPIEDLNLCDRVDDFNPDCDFELHDRDEYFYMPGKILHIDADDCLSNSIDDPLIKQNLLCDFCLVVI